MSYQKCPVCNGVRQVSGGYFNRVREQGTAAPYYTTETCKVCEGTGLINEDTGLPPTRVGMVEREIKPEVK